MRAGTTVFVFAVAATLSCDRIVDVRVANTYAAGGNTIAAVVQLAIDSGSAPAVFQIESSQIPSQTDLAALAAEAHRLTRIPGVVGVVGHPASREALAAAPIYDRAGIPHIAPTSTSRRLALTGAWTFRLVPSDIAEGAYIADYAIDSLGAERVSVLYIADEYGTGLRDGVATQLESRGRPIPDHAAVPGGSCADAGNADAIRLIVEASIRRGDPQVVVLALGAANVGCVANTVLAIRPNVHLLGADGVMMTSPAIISLPAATRARLKGVVFWVPGTDSATQAFTARVRRVLNREPHSTDALNYDAHMLLAAAIKEVGPDRDAIRGWLESLGRTRPPWVGLTGPISFEADRLSLLRMVPAGAR